MSDPAGTGRLAELTIALSLATDLGTGQPVEHGLRVCWLSLRAAEALGLDGAARQSVYYVALLRFVGCTSDASDTAVMTGGDDVAFNAVMAPMMNAASGESMRYFVTHLAEDLPFPRRMGRVARAMTDPQGAARSLSGHCEVAARFASRLGMADSVQHALAHAYERWDGKGYPDGASGGEVPQPVRIVSAARDLELWTRQADWATAVEVLTRRRGHAHDPAVIDALLGDGKGWLAEIDDDTHGQILDAEPAPVITIDADNLDVALSAVGDFADLKSPFFRGHSAGVADLAHAAALGAGLPSAEADVVRRAALVHDVGQVGVPSGIWDRTGPLLADQWERVRLHPYLTDRVLRRCELLQPFADVAAAHHERVDGSGYYRNMTTDQLSLGARVLAAADMYHAMTEARPHRDALAPGDAAAGLLDEVDAGRFMRAEVDAVLEAAGQESRPARVERPAGLTEREVDVLRLIARGRSNKEVAKELGLSAKTVGHHVEHVYAKAGVKTRAGATLFAMESGLLVR